MALRTSLGGSHLLSYTPRRKTQRPFLLHLALELPHGEDEYMEPVSSFQRMEATWEKKDPGELMGKISIFGEIS